MYVCMYLCTYCYIAFNSRRSLWLCSSMGPITILFWKQCSIVSLIIIMEMGKSSMTERGWTLILIAMTYTINHSVSKRTFLNLSSPSGTSYWALKWPWMKHQRKDHTKRECNSKQGKNKKHTNAHKHTQTNNFFY
jgi:hypothetical protein